MMSSVEEEIQDTPVMVGVVIASKRTNRVHLSVKCRYITATFWGKRIISEGVSRAVLYAGKNGHSSERLSSMRQRIYNKYNENNGSNPDGGVKAIRRQ